MGRVSKTILFVSAFLIISSIGAIIGYAINLSAGAYGEWAWVAQTAIICLMIIIGGIIVTLLHMKYAR